MNIDYSGYVLNFGNFRGIVDVRKLSPAGGGRASSSAQPAPAWRQRLPFTPMGKILALCLEPLPQHPEGWIFGLSSDINSNEIQIVVNPPVAVDSIRFLIDISPCTRRPRVTNLSNNAIEATDHDPRGRNVILEKTDSLDIASTLHLRVGLVQFDLWRPHMSVQEEREYFRRTSDYLETVLAAQTRATRPLNSNLSPFMMRCGGDNRWYVDEGAEFEASGSFASVKKVKKLETGWIYAAKVPHFSVQEAAGPRLQSWQLLKQEYNKMVELRHRNIVIAFDIIPGGLNGEPPWLIMEWIGANLESTRLQEPDVHRCLEGIAAGVGHMHTLGFTHRDLKPANILLHMSAGRLERAKIADFGSARRRLQGPMTTYVGTGLYMAPELLLTPPLAYGSAIDVWSYGIIALQALGPEWDGFTLSWRASYPPHVEQHDEWIRQNKEAHMQTVPLNYHPFLHGVLTRDPSARWTMAGVQRWLEENRPPVTADHLSPVSTVADTDSDE